MVYAAAGGTGVGVLQTAADEGILSIGVDSNQNHLHPVVHPMKHQYHQILYDQ